MKSNSLLRYLALLSVAPLAVVSLRPTGSAAVDQCEVALSASLAHPQRQFFSSSKDDTATHIARIENGLLPSVMIKGQPPPTMKLIDRMQYYHVPGVSIAFFDHGQIAWAGGYGVADTQTGRPVTPETLFQAGSISKPIAALGALRLVESGKLKLDENVNDELTSETSGERVYGGTEGHSSQDSQSQRRSYRPRLWRL